MRLREAETDDEYVDRMVLRTMRVLGGICSGLVTWSLSPALTSLWRMFAFVVGLSLLTYCAIYCAVRKDSLR